MREKRECQNPHHPFKQSWYYYEAASKIDSPKYCSGCRVYLNFMESVISSLKYPRETMYGGEIGTDADQIHEIVNRVFDEAYRVPN